MRASFASTKGGAVGTAGSIGAAVLAHDVSGHNCARGNVAVIRRVPPQQGQRVGSKGTRWRTGGTALCFSGSGDIDPNAFKPVDLAIPMFGYKNHIGIDRAHGLIRTWDASAANAHDGARLPDVVSKDNTGSGVWADTAYRSKKNEAFFEVSNWMLRKDA